MKVKRDELISALEYIRKNFDHSNVDVYVDQATQSLHFKGFDIKQQAVEIKVFREDNSTPAKCRVEENLKEVTNAKN